MFRKLAGSPSLQAGIVYAFGGLCFALGSLVLARVLSPQDFATIALIFAVSQLAAAIGPTGADTIINRHSVDPNPALIRRVCLTSSGIGFLVSLIAWRLYNLPPSVSVLTALICSASAINLVASAFFRSRGRFGMALGLTQGHNVVVAVAALITVLSASTSVMLPLAIIAGAYVASGLIGWTGAFRLQRKPDAIPMEKFPWHEGRTIIATTIAIIVLLQLERLTIPKLLDSEALATFAVLAAIAGSPFRVLQMGVGYTLVPQLRLAMSRQDRQRMIRSELIVAGLLSGAACVVIWLFTQVLVNWFLQGKYEISDWMIVAAIVSGLAKVLASFGRAGVVALGSQRNLSQLKTGSWIAVSVAFLGAVVGSDYGLVGLLFGVSVGWIFYAVYTLFLSRSVLANAG